MADIGRLDYLTFFGKGLKIMAFCDVLNPVYSAYRYDGDFVKVVKFKRSSRDTRTPRDNKSENEKVGDRFMASLSRSRSVILQYALSNRWEWFFTGTIDGSRHDRFNLDSFYSRFAQYIRDLRKKTGAPVIYLFVPEKHKDGAWHLHGLLAGLPDQSIQPFQLGVHPDALVLGGYKNWIDYSAKFGFCSLGEIQDRIKVAFYMTKYITKSLGDNIRGSGSHMYFVSRGLRKAEHLGDCYFHSSELDNFLSKDYDFCQVGFGRLPWVMACEYFDGIESEYDSFDFVAESVSESAFQDWIQMRCDVAGWCNGNTLTSSVSSDGSSPSPAPNGERSGS